MGSEDEIPLITESVSIWKALLKGECKLIDSSEAALVRKLETECHWYKPEDKDQWEIVSETQEIPVVQGEAKKWTGGPVHIHWKCPFCNREHHTDVDDDSSPSVWFCEFGTDIAKVHW